LRERFRPPLAFHCFDNVYAGCLPQTHHLGQKLWWMLAVAIHDNHSIAARSFQAGAKGQLLPEIAAQAQAVQSGQRFRFFRKDLPGLIRRPVINNDQLERRASLSQGGGNPGQKRP
jgi:hypothetical protein